MRSRAEVEALVNANIRLAYHCAAHFRRWASVRRHLDPEAVLSCCLVGLWAACQDHDEQRGAFSTFVFLCCRREIGRALHSARRGEVPVSQLGPDGGPSLLDGIAAPEEPAPDPWEVAKVRAAVRQLAEVNPRDAEVVSRRAEGETLHAIGQSLGVSGERARQCEARGLRRLRAALT